MSEKEELANRISELTSRLDTAGGAFPDNDHWLAKFMGFPWTDGNGKQIMEVDESVRWRWMAETVYRHELSTELEFLRLRHKLETVSEELATLKAELLDADNMERVEKEAGLR